MKEYHLKTPVSAEDIKDIRIGDIVYLEGTLVNSLHAEMWLTGGS